MIFTIQIIFQTCSEFDGEIFCKNRFLKKSFLKVLTNPNFAIFCSILVTKIEQKIAKFGLVRTFKNDFFKNLFLQKTFPSNSEQVWKIIYMVKINSLTSRTNFHDFWRIFRPRILPFGDFEVDFSLMMQICGQVISKSISRILLKFSSVLDNVLI